MILKIVVGRGARGLLNYVSQAAKSAHHPHLAQKKGERKQPAPPTFTNFAGSSPREIAAEFAALRLLKPNLGRAVGHLILSPSPNDRALTKDEWQAALQIALAAHGASAAPHAAWLHDDTDLQHLHVFFSRILPSGQVISDSQSYQKNRAASREIEKGLNMETFNSTPVVNAPGDRQAAANAAKRDERLGLKSIHQAEIRAALAEANDLADFESKLKNVGIEVEFSRRGASQEVFGWKLRRRGDDQWQKASTLARDLSWPNISHRFQTEPAPKPKTAADDFINLQPPAQPSQALAAKKKEERQADAEEMADASGVTVDGNPSPKTVAARQFRDQQHQRRMQAQHDKITSSNFAKSLGLFAEAISHFTLEMICRFLEWLRDWLLQKLGLTTTQRVTSSPNGRQRVELAPDTERIIEAETRVIEPQPEPLTLDYRLQQAAKFVEQAARAVEEKNFENLPGIGSKGRTELVAELQKTLKPDPAAVFSEAVSKQLKTLVAALVSHKKADAEVLEIYEEQSKEVRQLAASLEKARDELQRLKRLNSDWGEEHWALSSIGRKGPYHAKMEAAANKLARDQRESDALMKKITTRWQPLISAGEKRVVELKDWMKSASSDLFKAARRVAAFHDDARFSELVAALPKHVQVVTAAVNSRLTSPLHVDLQTPVNALRQALAEWDEAAKRALSEAPKSLSEEEQKERPNQGPEEDGFEVPR